jgi:hypothetical protein
MGANGAAMAQWINDEYFNWRQNFYAWSTPAGLPSTNNSHEGFHKWLKEDGTSRKRLSCGAFLRCMQQEIKHLSHEQGTPFPQCFEMAYSDWKDAHLWAGGNAKDISFWNKTRTSLCVPSSLYCSETPSRTDAKQAFVKWQQKIEPIRGEDLDAYFARRGLYYQLKLLKPHQLVSQFVLFACSCAFYAKNAFCKHSVGMGIVEKLFMVPVEFSAERLSGPTRRGRKPMAKNVCTEKQK